MGFVTALLMAAQPIRGLGNLSARVQEGLAAVERVYQQLDERPRVVDRPGAKPLAVSAGTIDFVNVSFTYPAGRKGPAVHDFTLSVPGGKTVALVGRSGAGKSTIINLVPRLFDVETGRITIDGQDIREVTLESLRAAIAIVSQDVTLFDDTIRANIAYGSKPVVEEEVVAAAKAAAAHDFIVGLPRGYDTRVGEAGGLLSGGERQRIAIARAIYKDAPILLLDEPTSSLDSEAEAKVQRALEELMRGRTVLMIAHRLSTVKKADLICVLDQGRIVESGRHEELVAKGGLYTRLHRTQLGIGGAQPAPSASDDAGREAVAAAGK
jgi:subfamily B ATP-binding cassette protein MsbA